jgi:putative two-component system response regulator
MPFFNSPPPEPKEGWVARLWHEQKSADPQLHDHACHMSLVSGAVAAELGLADSDVLKLQLAGHFHDIGKLDLPHDVLYAPRRLTEAEMEIIRRHSVLGSLRLKKVDETPILSFVEDVARHHHERYDGSGYPDGLAGEQTSLAARIAAACDVYSAMWERRSYKAPLSHDAVMGRLLDGDERMRPSMFDPNVLAALKDAQPRIRKLLPE